MLAQFLYKAHLGGTEAAGAVHGLRPSSIPRSHLQGQAPCPASSRPQGPAGSPIFHPSPNEGWLTGAGELDGPTAALPEARPFSPGHKSTTGRVCGWPPDLCALGCSLEVVLGGSSGGGWFAVGPGRQGALSASSPACGSPPGNPAGAHGLVSGSALSILQTENNGIWNVLNESNSRCAKCQEGSQWTLVEKSRGLSLEWALAGDKPAVLG